MKRIIITLLLACVVSTAHAGNRYSYGQDGQAFYFSGRYLYDSQTGQEVGYFSGKYLYDTTTGEQIGYLSNGYIYSSRDGSILGYCDQKDR